MHLELSHWRCHGQLSRSYVPNLSCNHFKQSCSSKGKITRALFCLMRQNRHYLALSSTDCKENYPGLRIPMCSFVFFLASLLQKLPLNKAPGADCIYAEHLLYANESLHFFSVNCLCVLFMVIYPIPV